ncbi:hypothetical protein BpHYR1_015825 [Brachionus plicatilis]|uniref:Uncharacterized protein n=1 Tax=Brachionus plicatilis TaxID=10195 RepID=A0A3M7SPJ0_BRAPC|nr:hypothetical protein BpHYR1_015825 [Brachionus plicatilis]
MSGIFNIYKVLRIFKFDQDKKYQNYPPPSRQITYNFLTSLLKLILKINNKFIFRCGEGEWIKTALPKKNTANI